MQINHSNNMSLSLINLFTVVEEFHYNKLQITSKLENILTQD